MRKTRTKPTATEPFVVVVNFPSSSKEYHYLCNDPLVRQGSTVIANGTKVKVIRTMVHAGPAYKYVQSDHEATTHERREAIMKRLAVIESFEARMDRYSKLKSSEAKRLVTELKELCK